MDHGRKKNVTTAPPSESPGGPGPAPEVASRTQGRSSAVCGFPPKLSKGAGRVARPVGVSVLFFSLRDKAEDLSDRGQKKLQTISGSQGRFLLVLGAGFFVIVLTAG